ncbi:putative methyltransferase-domain-containing protein [Geopyxis carbonaria]|nr:putative methyltransferase-domain-containing protein [Geopyxis carbonaria]
MAVSKKKKKTGSVLLSRNRGVERRVDPLQSRSLSSKAGRTLIRSHHTLQKQLAQAKARNDIETVQAVQEKIAASGGLEKYQQASVIGQSAQRGGDSSKLLMQWIHETQNKTVPKTSERKLRLLEVGCLSVDNAVSKSSFFDVTRIDLNSRDTAIQSQDFMERPLPKSAEEKFDIISLSLVLNYVPEASGRGEMLRRTAKFLHEKSSMDLEDPLAQIFPSLFLVLPAPCVTNSRYFNESKLEEIMGSIGYIMVKRKLSMKLVYSLWRLSDVGAVKQKKKVKKTEVNPGKTRNNFAVVLD